VPWDPRRPTIRAARQVGSRGEKTNPEGEATHPWGCRQPIYGEGVAIRTALINDYPVVVHGLAALLRRYGDVVEVVELNANTAVDEPVDIALFDTFAMSRADDVEMKELLDNGRIGRLVVYSWNTRTPAVDAALKRGASGYLSKTLPASRVVDALMEIHRGTVVVATGGDDKTVAGDWPGREEGLTAREAEVMALITQGLSNKEIADRAGVSINSVKSYIRTAYRRIGVTTRPTAILWGIENGFAPQRMRVSDPATQPR